MTTRTFDTFTEAVRAAPGCPQTKDRIMALFVSLLGGQRVRVPDALDDPVAKRVAFVRYHLAAGYCRSEIVRLAERRFGVSERTAWLDVERALRRGPR